LLFRVLKEDKTNMAGDETRMESATRRDVGSLLILFGLAFVVRLYLAFHTYVIANDGAFYVKLAQLISIGKVGEAIHLHFFSLFPFLIALFQRVFLDWESSGQMVSVLFGSLAIIPFYFLTKDLFSRSIALISSILFVFHPYLVRFSAEVIKEPTFWFFSLTALWFGWMAVTRKKNWLFALTSLWAMAACLLRIEGIFILAIIAVWIFLRDIKSIRSNYKQRILNTSVLFLTVLIIVSPAMLYIRGKAGSRNLARTDLISEMVHGDFTMQEIKKNLDRIEFKSKESGSQADLEEIRLRGFLTLAKDHRMAIIWLDAISKFFKVIHPVLIIPLFFGVFRRRKIEYRKEEELFLLSVLAIFFLLLVRYGTIRAYIGTRHMIIPALACFPWVGAGVSELGYRIRNIFSPEKPNNKGNIFLRNSGWFLMVLIVLLVLPKTLASQRAEKIPIKEAGIWIKKHGPKDAVIMAQDDLARIAFYANATFLNMPRDQNPLAYAREKRVNFIAVNQKNIDQSYPGLKESLNLEYLKKEIVIGKSSGSYVISIYSIRN
jgi:hypothetical protein